MNKTMKLIAAAAALGAAVPAFAKIEVGNNPELILVAYDEVAKVSFTKDLGTFADAFKTQFDGHSKAAAMSWNVSADANWNTFAGVANVGALKWVVLAWDNASTKPGDRRLFTTALDTVDNKAKIGDWTNLSFQTAMGTAQLGAFFTTLNGSNAHKNSVDGSSVNYSTDTGNGYWAKKAGDFYNTNSPFSNANAFGGTSEFFLLSNSSMEGSDYAKFERFESVGGTASTFTFGDKDGNVVLMAAAVPEPSTYAMLLGGLLALGLVVRRRTTDRR